MTANVLLSIAEAARRLDVPRPHATLLADLGKLGPVQVEDGRRFVLATAVDAYKAARRREHIGAMSPRQAAVAAGLYDLDRCDTEQQDTVRSLADTSGAAAETSFEPPLADIAIRPAELDD